MEVAMDIENYAFTLLAALSGMLVVFAILALLSGMMLLMARLISPAANAGSHSSPTTVKAQSPSDTARHKEDVVVSLVVVAAAAHLHCSAEEERHSAVSWHPQSKELLPWSMR